MSLPDALRLRLKRFRGRLRKLQADANTRNVHQFRIACRELLACRALLKNFAPADQWKPVVKQALDSLDRLRDLQQLRDRLLQEQSIPTSVVNRVFNKPVGKAMARWEEISPVLQATDFMVTITTMEKALRSEDNDSQKLQFAWKEQWKKSLRRVRKSLATTAAENPDSLHRLRIRYKQLRYLLELQLDSGVALRIKKAQLKRWQDELGNVGDFSVMAQYVGKLKLPAHLQHQFLQKAAEYANRCITKRPDFEAFLLELDRQLEKLC